MLCTSLKRLSIDLLALWRKFVDDADRGVTDEVSDTEMRNMLVRQYCGRGPGGDLYGLLSQQPVVRVGRAPRVAVDAASNLKVKPRASPSPSLSLGPDHLRILWTRV